MKAATRRFGIFGTVWFVGVAGCASPAGKSANSPRPPELPLATVPDTTGQPLDEQHQATLAAVEDFLERTRAYSQPAVAAPSAPPAAIEPLPARPASVSDQVFANTQVSLSVDAPAKATLAIPALQSVSVRSTDPDRTTHTEPPKSNTTNTPLELGLDESTNLGERFVDALRTDAQSKKSFDAEWRLRLVQLALGRDTEAAQVSEDTPEPAKGLLAALIQAAAAVKNAVLDPIASGRDALRRTAALRDALAELADPAVSAVALCRKVVTFGAYEEMTPDDFAAGRSIQTIVYSEIANLRTHVTDDGLQETRLSTRIEVFTVDGQSVWQREEPEILDRCRRRRTDFFIAQRITLPPTLPAGEYVLKVLVEDKLADKVDESSVRFSIASPASLAQSKRP